MLRKALGFIYVTSLLGVVIAGAAVLGTGDEHAKTALKCFLASGIGSLATLMILGYFEELARGN